MELTMRIELMTSPLPRGCSTTEPREPINLGHSGQEVGGAVALYQLSYARTLPISNSNFINGGERRIRTFEGIKPTDLQSVAFGHSAISPQHISSTHSRSQSAGAGYRDRTYDLRFTKPLLYQLS